MGIKGIDADYAISFYQKEVYRVGKGSFQVWAAAEYKRLYKIDIDPRKAISLLFDKGQHPLQNWAVFKLESMGMKGIDAKYSLSHLFGYYWKIGKSSLQEDAMKVLSNHTYVKDIKGKAPTSENAVALYTQLRAHIKHKQSIIYLSGDEKTKNWRVVKTADNKDKKVFCIGYAEGGKGLYDYINLLVKFVDTNDWRMKLDEIKKLNLDMWQVAQVAKMKEKAAHIIQSRQRSISRPTNVQMVDNNGMDHDGVATVGLEALKRAREARDDGKKNDDKKKNKKKK